MKLRSIVITLIGLLICMETLASDKAPDWMQVLKTAPVPTHDEKADMAVMYIDTQLVVQPNGSMKSFERFACKVLRTDSTCGLLQFNFDKQTSIESLRAWTIPVQGKDYVVKERDFYEAAGGEGFELVTDSRVKGIKMPGIEPGAIIGFEIEQDIRPLFLQDVWQFQGLAPVREAHYTLQLPPGWSYQAHWINYPEQAAVNDAGGITRWAVTNVKAIKSEHAMTPYEGITGSLLLSLFPPEGKERGFTSWDDVAKWNYQFLIGRRDVNPAIKQKVAELTAGKASTFDKVKALAAFAQRDIRYVAIELGIGGYQPHLASETFKNRYGDCKDKSNLLGTMLDEIGVQSYFVTIYAERGIVTDKTPPTDRFNHAILAILLPPDPAHKTLPANVQSTKFGQLLFFDPTNEELPFGDLQEYLEGNYALIVSSQGGELVQLPILPKEFTGNYQSGKYVLQANGDLQGEADDIYRGEYAAQARAGVKRSTHDDDVFRTVEHVLGNSIAKLNVDKVSVKNQIDLDKPFEISYSLKAEKYAKTAGDMLLVRPHVVGTYASGFLENDDKRQNDIVFQSLEQDKEDVEITLPAGYTVDELPAAVDIDTDFAAYHSKASVKDGILKYTRSVEIKVLQLPATRAEELKKFYRQIAGDERANAVLVRK